MAQHWGVWISPGPLSHPCQAGKRAIQIIKMGRPHFIRKAAVEMTQVGLLGKEEGKGTGGGDPGGSRLDQKKSKATRGAEGPRVCV